MDILEDLLEKNRLYQTQGICPYCGAGCSVGSGYCHCGCGQKTGLVQRTHLTSQRPNDYPRVRGMPNKFRSGHFQGSNGQLTREDVRKIRYIYATDESVTQKQLAEEYGVTKITIHHVVNLKTWKKAGIATPEEMKEAIDPSP